MDVSSWLIGENDIIESIWNELIESKKSIYMSLNRIDWDYQHPKTGQRFLDLINKVCENKVNVYILLPEEISSEQVQRMPKLNVRCTIRLVTNFGPIIGDHLLPLTRTTREIMDEFKDDPLVQNFNSIVEQGIYSHNQCYILIDEDKFIIGSIPLALGSAASDRPNSGPDDRPDSGTDDMPNSGPDDRPDSGPGIDNIHMIVGQGKASTKFVKFTNPTGSQMEIRHSCSNYNQVTESFQAQNSTSFFVTVSTHLNTIFTLKLLTFYLTTTRKTRLLITWLKG